ncbi:MAG: ImmA/IrrE family metallo-endopeptidase [Methanobrevibacter sp.]|nr:ImmA/IrrE family metallo-endopeptidase [Methanobrevibacter sp.]
MISNSFYLEINELAKSCRRSWKIGIDEPIDIFSLAINKMDNLTIVFKKMDNDISGAAIRLNKKSLIFVNSLDSKGRQAFTIAHELYHLKFDESNSFNLCGISSDDEIEKKADQFASCFLMPHDALEIYKINNSISKWNLDEIIKAEQYFQISHQAFLWRIRTLNEISAEEYMSFKKDIKYNAMIRGYDLSLYDPHLNQDYLTVGDYIKSTEKIYENDLISRGRREELLLDAYRADIVYNLEKFESF